ncbi:MAG: DUF1292 domain-containing protein [Candidatus Gastranaerophilales bacterium]|nr:DUF1292 domain-containing protein [Candidatus Gastranaerophilales bacterium]
MQENAPEIINVIGEHGEEITMKLQEIVNVEGQDYALLSIVEEDTLPNSDNDEEEIIIMRMIKTDDDCTFEIIEDDKEFEMVAMAINEADEFDEE